MRLLTFLFISTLFVFTSTGYGQKPMSGGRTVWSAEQAVKWSAKQPWLVGANFLPSTAINQLEMWQGDSFDTLTISRELKWASGIGMNTMRIFLHDLAYAADPTGFKKRMDIVLQIASRYGIRPLFVIFDSCWDPFPHTGKQHTPAPYLHNSGWVQSPGADALKDATQYKRLEKYVIDVVRSFRNDPRILGWDVWNEPDNTNEGSYNRFEPYDKVALVEKLLPQVFQWARMANPVQPLTSGIWAGNWSSDNSLSAMQKIMIQESDIISFHNYENAASFEKHIQWLQRYHKPLLCTEYMARPNHSTFQEIMPVAKKYHVGVINWGFVNGKSQTIYPWDSWRKKYDGEPVLWFHDIFRANGTPYQQEEVQFIKTITGR
ncbi:MAG: cellulase family glycosylhydrolase [Bacteroidota bacterium]|nr:cellulase family glycosylhydrolase [Bacteroidota bacterium]